MRLVGVTGVGMVEMETEDWMCVCGHEAEAHVGPAGEFGCIEMGCECEEFEQVRCCYCEEPLETLEEADIGFHHECDGVTT